MNISDKDLKAALQKLVETKNITEEEFLQNDFTYVGNEAVQGILGTAVNGCWELINEREKYPVINRQIMDYTGLNLNLNYELDILTRVWLGVWNRSGEGKEVGYVSTLVVLPRDGYKFFVTNKQIVMPNGKPWGNRVENRFGELILDFSRDKINRIYITYKGNTGVTVFSTAMDKLVKHLIIERRKASELFGIDRVGDLRMQDLVIDYRPSNLAATPEEAAKHRLINRYESKMYVLRKKAEQLLPYVDLPELKPWADWKHAPILGSDTAYTLFKNVFPHQKKFSVRHTPTYRTQFQIASCYNLYVAALYSDAYVMKHWDELTQPEIKLNFPHFRNPLQCICPQCSEHLNIVKKRGPQPKIDQLFFVEEYVEYMNENDLTLKSIQQSLNEMLGDW